VFIALSILHPIQKNKQICSIVSSWRYFCLVCLQKQRSGSHWWAMRNERETNLIFESNSVEFYRTYGCNKIERYIWVVKW